MLRRVAFGLGVVLAAWLAGAFARAADAPTEATVTDAEGKEVKVEALKFGAGTRRLAWLADPSGATEEAKKGPLVLELREPHSTTYKRGVVTYVPVASVESIKYDHDKDVATVAVKGLDAPLSGVLGYPGVNVLGLSGTADGKAVSFRGGGSFAKGNIKAVAFPGAQPVPPRKGTSAWQVQIDQPRAKNPTLTVGELKFLYQFPGGVEVLTDAATLHKGEPLKLDASVTSYLTLAVDLNADVIVAEVAVGDKERVVVIVPTMEKDGKKGTLVGMVGEVEAGWKMFPLTAIKNMKRPKRD